MSMPTFNRADALPAKQPLRSAVFIDKNGTLIEEVPNNVAPGALRFMPNAFEAIKKMSDHGHAIVVVTSEPGLGLGLFNRSALSAFEHAMITRIRAETGVEVAGFYTCPHKPGPRGEPACLCRVPAPGLLRQAAISLRLDLQRSWMIGDMLNDIEAGRRVGCRTVLIDVGHETNWRMSPLRTPHHRVSGLLEAAGSIVACQAVSGLSLEIQLTDEARDAPGGLSSGSTKPNTSRVGPLRGFEPHPTREWL